MNAPAEPKTQITIVLSERRPIRIVDDEWPVLASAASHDGMVRSQANTLRTIRVREHADGRRIVYGWIRAGGGGKPISWRGTNGGFLVAAGDEDETVRAIRRMAGVIGDPLVADECLANMPAEPLP